MPKKFRVLFVADGIYPDSTGGVHTYVASVAKGLAGKGHEITILTERVRPELPETESQDGITIIRYASGQPKPAFLAHQERIRHVEETFLSFLFDKEFDFIYFHSSIAGCGVLNALKRPAILVYGMHALHHEEELFAIRSRKFSWNEWQGWLKPLWVPFYIHGLKRIEHRVIKACARVVVLSDYMAKKTQKAHGISPERICKIPAGVPLDIHRPADEFKTVRTRFGLQGSEKVLLTLRRLVPRMGIETLIRAVPGMLQKNPDIRVWIGGEGPLRSDLETLVNELQISNAVKFLGKLSQNDLVASYQAADLFVLPSKTLEGFGIVTIESLACGTPVLGTSVGGTVEILSALDARCLIQGESPENMGQSILEFLNWLEHHPEFRVQCRRFAEERYGQEVAVQKTETLFQNLDDTLFSRLGKAAT